MNKKDYDVLDELLEEKGLTDIIDFRTVKDRIAKSFKSVTNKVLFGDLEVVGITVETNVFLEKEKIIFTIKRKMKDSEFVLESKEELNFTKAVDLIKLMNSESLLERTCLAALSIKNTKKIPVKTNKPGIKIVKSVDKEKEDVDSAVETSKMRMTQILRILFPDYDLIIDGMVKRNSSINSALNKIVHNDNLLTESIRNGKVNDYLNSLLNKISVYEYIKLFVNYEHNIPVENMRFELEKYGLVKFFYKIGRNRELLIVFKTSDFTEDSFRKDVDKVLFSEKVDYVKYASLIRALAETISSRVV